MSRLLVTARESSKAVDILCRLYLSSIISFSEVNDIPAKIKSQREQ